MKVMLDTCFLVALLKSDEEHHESAKKYFNCFLREKTPMYVSAIAIAEYCVTGKVADLPLRKIRQMVFSVSDAPRTGAIAKILFARRRKLPSEEKGSRKIIPNDSKLFAQADVSGLNYFVTYDDRALKSIGYLKEQLSQSAMKPLGISGIDIRNSYASSFGVLDL